MTVMRDHQKYFAVEGADGKLMPHFLAVLNIEVDQEGYATIQHGNQKVLRARFKDAQFFWDTDQKTPLVDPVESLKSVTFRRVGELLLEDGAESGRGAGAGRSGQGCWRAIR